MFSFAVLGMESTSIEAWLSVLDARDKLTRQNVLGNFVMTVQEL